MVERVIKVRTDLQLRGLRKLEKLVQAEVNTPASWASENVAFGKTGVVEGVSTNGRGRKRSGAEELIALLRIGAHSRDHDGAEACAVETADRVEKLTADVPREDGITIVTGPIRSKVRTALGEHVPGELETAEG